jgi:4-amino-4-deoxy-L-arabinose transferase-like glycosyltransferase
MARGATQTGRCGLRSRLVTEPQARRPRAPWSLRLIGVGVLALLAWLLFGSALSVVRAVVALAGYVVVAFLAYVIGKWVGRREASR